ncbi:MAG: ribonuclease HI [Actinomycetaceae bacterium]|nr:ribonuclease HI [Actinomycetaceae bacterium]
MEDLFFAMRGKSFDGQDVSRETLQKANVIQGSGPVGSIKKGYDAIYATDGSCIGNPGPGGWAWVEQISGKYASGGSMNTTNNVMELTAVLEVLKYHQKDTRILLRIDSQYVINVMKTWGATWKKNGWRKTDKKPIKNKKLVREVYESYVRRAHNIDIEWVKGHNGDKANEMCDHLAVEAAKQVSKNNKN